MIAPRPERINISTLHERAGTLCLVHMYLGGDPLGGRVCTSPNFLHFGIWFTKLEREAIFPHLDFNIVLKLMGIERASHRYIPSPAHQRGCVSLHPLLGHLLPSVVTCPLMSIAPGPAGSLVFSLWMWAAGRSLLHSLADSHHSPLTKRVSDVLHLYIWGGTSGCLRESSSHMLTPSQPGSLRKPAPDISSCCFCS